jgi:hypothetical protein
MTMKNVKINLMAMMLAIVLGYVTGCSKDNFEDQDGIDIKGQGPIEDGDYYVATWGNDTNSGTFDKPWATWQKAIEVAIPGDKIYIRGGVYFGNGCIRIEPYNNFGKGFGHSGTKEDPICYYNYPGETPIYDLSKYEPEGNWNVAITLEYANYIHFKGLTIKNVWQYRDGVTARGIEAYGCSNLTFENMTICNIGGRAFGFFGGFGNLHTIGYPDVPYDTTRYINCDAYNICDSYCNDLSSCETTHVGGIADGFKFNNTAGAFVSFEGCRIWNYSDNGIDVSGAALAIINNCWVWDGGRLDGEGSGFKYGALRTDITSVTRVITHCISAYNKYLGFDENNSGGSYYPLNLEAYNNTSYSNLMGYGNFSYMEGRTYNNKYRNNISYKDSRYARGDEAGDIIEDHNSWLDGNYQWPNAERIPITDADFVSLNLNELTRPRQADGSLPEINFMKLKPGSALINEGTDVGLPFIGDAPDLGAFERE